MNQTLLIGAFFAPMLLLSSTLSAMQKEQLPPTLPTLQEVLDEQYAYRMQYEQALQEFERTGTAEQKTAAKLDLEKRRAEAARLAQEAMAYNNTQRDVQQTSREVQAGAPVGPIDLSDSDKQVKASIDAWEKTHYIARTDSNLHVSTSALYDGYMQSLQTLLDKATPGSLEQRVLFIRMATMQALNNHMTGFIAYHVAQHLDRKSAEQAVEVCTEIAAGKHVEAKYIRNTFNFNPALNLLLAQTIEQRVKEIMHSEPVIKACADLLNIQQTKRTSWWGAGYVVNPSFSLVDDPKALTELNTQLNAVAAAVILEQLTK